MYVASYERIHAVTSCGDSSDLLLRKCWQYESVRHVDAKLVATPTAARVAVQSRINAVRFVPPTRLGSYTASGHANVNKAAVLMPDRVGPGTEC
jgi:hypothetical protein